MPLNTSVSENDDLSFIHIDTNVYRQLIQQFCERSTQRYGADSDQTRMLKQHLAAHVGDAA